MRKPFLAIRLFALWLCLLAGARVVAQETALDMPIADLHWHPEKSLRPADVAPVLERAGVRWFGLGEKDGGPAVLEDYKRFFGDRFIAFGGQSHLNAIWRREGTKIFADPLANEDFRKLRGYLNRGLGDGTLAGVGEIFANNLNSTPFDWHRQKWPLDGPAVKALYEVVARHNAFIAFHMEGAADSIEQLERLAASDRRGRIILNHCGVNVPPQEMDRLFSVHSNLYCEVSVRYPPIMPPRPYTQIFGYTSINPEWRELIIKHADRIMVGTDASNTHTFQESINNVRRGLLANLPPEVARKVAYGNAVALFGLK